MCIRDRYYASNRKITLECDSPNVTYINFNSNDSDTSNILYDCRILSQGGTSGTPGSGTLTLYSKTTTFKGDVDASQNDVSCKTLTLNGSDLASTYYTKVQSDNNYCTKQESDNIITRRQAVATDTTPKWTVIIIIIPRDRAILIITPRHRDI